MKLSSPSFGSHLRRNVSLRRAGFTLVEIMIVVLIIGLLAMIAIPNVKRALDKARLESIKANLRTIDSVKTMWAAENKKGGDASPSAEELTPYFNNKTFPKPVVGETYNVGRIDDPPTATLGSKILEQPAGSTITLLDN